MMDVSGLPSEQTERAFLLQKILIDIAVGKMVPGDEDRYRKLRRLFLSEVGTRFCVPTYVRDCRDLFSFHRHIMRVRKTYSERRELIEADMLTLHNLLEEYEFLPKAAPADDAVAVALQHLSAAAVEQVWKKALERRTTDPEGAITSARQLLESVCKHMLDDFEVPYGDDDLPKLYRRCAEKLKLAPSQHDEDAFKRVLGGCQTVVQTLGEIRNKIGDAHGSGRAPVRVAPRHAALVVNLAGAMAMFLVETYQACLTASASPE